MIAFVNGEKQLSQGKVFLSFDDGLREVYTIIAPILKERGLPATFFITTDFIDNKKLFYRNKASLLIEAIAGLKPEEPLNKQLVEFCRDYHLSGKNVTEVGAATVGAFGRVGLDIRTIVSINSCRNKLSQTVMNT